MLTVWTIASVTAFLTLLVCSIDFLLLFSSFYSLLQVVFLKFDGGFLEFCHCQVLMVMECLAAKKIGSPCQRKTVQVFFFFGNNGRPKFCHENAHCLQIMKRAFAYQRLNTTPFFTIALMFVFFLQSVYAIHSLVKSHW
jgi:hypothetical protein